MADINISLTGAQAIFTVSGLEMAINKYEKACRDTDKQFGSMNNIHRAAMRHMLTVRDTLVASLRAEGYAMDSLEQYDVNAAPWVDIKD